MTPVSHHLDEAQAQKLVDGVLARDEALSLDRHVASCPECRASVETYRMLSGALDALEFPEPPPDFTQGVLSRLQAGERASAHERRWAVGIVATMLAATVAAFAAAGPSAWTPGLSSAAQAISDLARAFRIGESFVPAVVGAFRFQILVAAALLALPLVIVLARLVPAPRTEIV